MIHLPQIQLSLFVQQTKQNLYDIKQWSKLSWYYTWESPKIEKTVSSQNSLVKLISVFKPLIKVKVFKQYTIFIIYPSEIQRINALLFTAVPNNLSLRLSGQQYQIPLISIISIQCYIRLFNHELFAPNVDKICLRFTIKPTYICSHSS